MKMCMDVFVTILLLLVNFFYVHEVWTLSTKLKYVCCLSNNVSCEIICHWWPSSFYQNHCGLALFELSTYISFFNFIFIFIPIRGILNLLVIQLERGPFLSFIYVSYFKKTKSILSLIYRRFDLGSFVQDT